MGNRVFRLVLIVLTLFVSADLLYADVTGSIRPTAPARSGAAAPDSNSGTPKPNPISDTVIFVAPPDREARLERRDATSQARSPHSAHGEAGDHSAVIIRTARS